MVESVLYGYILHFLQGEIMIEHVDVLIVGAGPAGLFLAKELLGISNQTVALVDSGRSIKKRYCPLVNKGNCTQCNICHVVEGVGGAGMYSDGKLSSFPAGSGLVKLLGSEEKVIELNNYVLDPFISKMNNDGIKQTKADESQDSRMIQQATDNKLDWKCYDVYHIGTEGIIEYCIELEEELVNGGLNLLTQTKLKSVEKKEDIFISTLRNRRGEEYQISSSNLVMATGKASGHVLRNIMDKLNVNYSFNEIELGVRVETEREGIVALSETHLDAKIKTKMDDGAEVRTFCMCNGGYLVNCYYDSYVPNEKICTISGFSFRDKKSDNANFGVLVRQSFPDYVDPMGMQLGIIQAINRASGYGGTIVQRYEDFIANRPTSKEGLENNSIQSTLPEATPVNLRWVLPDYVTNHIESFLGKLSGLSNKLITKDTLLHAPVWELCWDKVHVDEHLRTNISGFYVAGDAIGWARGIIQAATTGVVIARDIHTRNKELVKS